MKFIFYMLFLFVAVSSGNGGKKVTVSTVHYASGKDSVSNYLCVPEGRGPFAAIIIIHEWWGLNDWIKENAKNLAAQGYLTLAVDLYRGKSTESPDEAHELMRGLPEDRAVRDLVAASEFLKARSDVNKKMIGTVGWCMGGGYALVTALNVPDLASCVICYGRLVTDSSSIAKIPCPMLGIFGEEDRGITPQNVHEFEAACKTVGKRIDVKIYPGAGHAFMNPHNTKGYQKKNAADASKLIEKFFDQTLTKE
ncbi:MAG: dienelactone hydrolase family protein [Ignavibacteria bacterium]|nr:dienelactone hydrolase family protein [Ignavibacteria bacterium]